MGLTMRVQAAYLMLFVSSAALAGPRAECADQLRIDLPTSDPAPKSWEFPSLSSELVWDLVVNGFSVVAEGDFDGDKKKDVAFLINAGIPREPMIAACMTSTKKVVVLRNLGCVAGIATRTKTKGDNADSIGTDCLDDKGRSSVKYVEGKLQNFPDPYED